MSMSISDNNEQVQQPTERKKFSLEEVMKQKLASKKNEQLANNNFSNAKDGNKKMQSQQFKKVNNQRRRMGV